jgi:hypothetical protein
MQNKPKKTKNELKTTFHTQVLELSEYLRSWWSCICSDKPI